MAPRKNTKSASTPAPVAASKVAKVPAGRKNTKPAPTSAPVAASKTAKVPAGRKNIKSASTPAPVADSETAKVHTGRKTRAIVAAEEKAAAEAGNNAVNANVAATQTVKVVKPAAAKVKTEEPAKLAKPVKEAVKPVKAVKAVKPVEPVKLVKPSVTKAKTVEPVKMAQPVKETVETVKPAATKVKTVEPAEMAQPVKGNTLKSASNALKALRGAAPTNQDDTTGEVPTSTTKPAIMQPATATPAVTNDITTKPAATIKTKAATTSATKATATSATKATATSATKATATTATSAKVPRAIMSMAQAAEFIKTFRCFRSSEKTPFANAHVTKKHRTKKRVVKEAVDPSSIPVFSVQPPQAVVDAELTKWLLADSKKPTPWGTQIEPVGPGNMASDFEAMGFSSDKVKELVVMKEPRKVDGLMQLVPLNTGAGSFVPGTGPEPPKRARRAAKYHDLKLFEDKDWVLFDPLKPYPVGHGEPPFSITRWATFVPGNARVLVMNTKTKTIRSQATPPGLLNHTVEYTPSGPKIVDWTPIKNPNKKPSSSKPAPAPPLLGRGAKRNAARVVVPEAPPPALRAPAAKKTSIKRKADEISAAEPPPPAPSAPAVKKTSTSAPKRKASEIAASEPPPAASLVPAAAEPPPTPAAKKRKTGPKKASTTNAPKKRKADEISAAAEPAVPSSAPVAAPPAPKKRKTKAAAATAALPPSPPPAVVVAAPVAPSPPAPVAPLAGVKRKRRATRPKKTPAVVENSSSE